MANTPFPSPLIEPASKRSCAIRRSARLLPMKRSSCAAGNWSSSTGGMKLSRAISQKGLAVKGLTPPVPPARSYVGADRSPQVPQPRPGDAVAHDRHHHHDGCRIDIAPEKAQRGRRCSRAAAVDGTTEAEAKAVLGLPVANQGGRGLRGYLAECSAPL